MSDDEGLLPWNSNNFKDMYVTELQQDMYVAKLQQLVSVESQPADALLRMAAK
jgi:hypothetical protein